MTIELRTLLSMDDLHISFDQEVYEIMDAVPIFAISPNSKREDLKTVDKEALSSHIGEDLDTYETSGLLSSDCVRSHIDFKLVGRSGGEGEPNRLRLKLLRVSAKKKHSGFLGLFKRRETISFTLGVSRHYKKDKHGKIHVVFLSCFIPPNEIGCLNRLSKWYGERRGLMILPIDGDVDKDCNGVYDHSSVGLETLPVGKTVIHSGPQRDPHAREIKVLHKE